MYCYRLTTNMEILYFQMRKKYRRLRKRRLDRVKQNEKDAEIFNDLAEYGEFSNKKHVIALDINYDKYHIENDNKKFSNISTESTVNTNDIKVNEEFCSSLKEWTPRNVTLQNAIPKSTLAISVIEKVIGVKVNGMEAKRTRMHVESLEDVVDYQELLRVTRISNEIRRNFWLNFPPVLKLNKPLHEQKQFNDFQGIIKKLNDLETRVRDFRDYAKNSSNGILSNLLQDTMEQISKATGDWEKWLSLQQRKRAKKIKR